MGAFEQGRDSEAGSIYAQKHYGSVMLLRRIKTWGGWLIVGGFLLYWYSLGKS